MTDIILYLVLVCKIANWLQVLQGRSIYNYVKNYACKIKKKKRLSRKAKFRIALASILLVVVGVFFYYFKIVCPIIITLSEEKVRSLSTQIISNSIAEVLTEENFSYDDIVTITYDSNNDVKTIEVNSVNVNLVARYVTTLVQTEMNDLGEEGIDIALGTFTGIPFLFGVWPMISLQLVPVGTVTTLFKSDFSTAGINQTLHQLYFEIKANVGMVLPAMTTNFETSLDVILCEQVIVGKIPEIYLQGQII